MTNQPLLAVWTTPIIDRTQADVDFAREHKRDLESYKGAQNSADWNRLTRNMSYIANILNLHGYDVPITCRVTWPVDCVPLVKDIEEVRDNIIELRYALYGYFGITWQDWESQGLTWAEVDVKNSIAVDYFSTFSIPTLPYTYYEKINGLEEWTLILERLIAHITGSYRISGTFSCGQQSYLPRYIEPHTCDMSWAEWDFLDRSWAQIDKDGRSVKDYFNKCYDPEAQMTWAEWDALGRAWQHINAESRIAIEYFQKG